MANRDFTVLSYANCLDVAPFSKHMRCQGTSYWQNSQSLLLPHPTEFHPTNFVINFIQMLLPLSWAHGDGDW